jgi:hypothetical protein
LNAGVPGTLVLDAFLTNQGAEHNSNQGV